MAETQQSVFFWENGLTIGDQSVEKERTLRQEETENREETARTHIRPSPKI
jgi:hypothetical protein